MQYKESELNYHGKYSPTIDFENRIYLNPKIYKLSKLFSKNYSIGMKKKKERRHSVDKPIKEKPKNSNKQITINPIPSEKGHIFHLPQLPTIVETNQKNSYVFHNYKLIMQLPNIEQKEYINKTHTKERKKSESKQLNGLQTFQFDTIEEYKANRTTSISKFSAKFDEDKTLQNISKNNPEEKSDNKRKIIFSKKNHAINVKDFSCFFDYQDIQRAHNTSFSNC